MFVGGTFWSALKKTVIIRPFFIRLVISELLKKNMRKTICKYIIHVDFTLQPCKIRISRDSGGMCALEAVHDPLKYKVNDACYFKL